MISFLACEVKLHRTYQVDLFGNVGCTVVATSCKWPCSLPMIWSGGWQAQSKVEMYSESTGWKELPPLPTARLRSAVVAGRNMQNSLMVTMGDKIPPVENQVVCWTKGPLFCSLDDISCFRFDVEHVQEVTYDSQKSG